MTEPATPTVGDTFAERVHHFRKLRGWSNRRLSEGCAAIGAPGLTEPSLVNIGRKGNPRRVTVEEWLVLAIALQVPPLALITPAGSTAAVAVTPDHVMPIGELLGWVASAESLAAIEAFRGVDRLLAR